LWRQTSFPSSSGLAPGDFLLLEGGVFYSGSPWDQGPPGTLNPKLRQLAGPGPASSAPPPNPAGRPASVRPPRLDSPRGPAPPLSARSRHLNRSRSVREPMLRASATVARGKAGRREDSSGGKPQAAARTSPSKARRAPRRRGGGYSNGSARPALPRAQGGNSGGYGMERPGAARHTARPVMEPA
jgi:hypothetical protein